MTDFDDIDNQDRAIISLLCDFFLDEFREDASGVADWLSRDQSDPEFVIAAVESLRESINDQA